jgi:hypothetical protein
VNRVISEFVSYSKKAIEELKQAKAKLGVSITAALEEGGKWVKEDQLCIVLY